MKPTNTILLKVWKALILMNQLKLSVILMLRIASPDRMFNCHCRKQIRCASQDFKTSTDKAMPKMRDCWLSKKATRR